MDERDWKIIKILYEERNVTKTAKRFYITQPALTARIRQIEEDLGTRLLYRSNKGITFTEAGEHAAKFASHILGEFQNFREVIAHMQDDIAGIISLAAPNILARYYLPRLLGQFQETYPKVKFNLQMAKSSDVLAYMNSTDLNFGFVRNDVAWPDDEKVLLDTNYVCAVAAHPFELADLPRMVRVDYDTDQYYQAILDRWWADTYSEPPIIGMKVSNLDLCKEMVFNGLGYGILPSVLVTGYPQLYSYILCHKDGTKLVRRTWLLFKKELLNMRLLQVFLDFVRLSDFGSFLTGN